MSQPVHPFFSARTFGMESSNGSEISDNRSDRSVQMRDFGFESSAASVTSTDNLSGPDIESSIGANTENQPQGPKLPKIEDPNQFKKSIPKHLKSGALVLVQHKSFKHFSVTVQYINDEWELLDRAMSCCQYTKEDTKTESIREMLSEFLDQNGLSDLSDRVVWVTDQGSNYLAALRGGQFQSIRCIDHMLNCVAQESMEKKRLAAAIKTARIEEEILISENQDYEQPPGDEEVEQLDESDPDFNPISACVVACKSAVETIKRRGLMRQLKKSIKQSVATRWFSNLEMLKSIYGKILT